MPDSKTERSPSARRKVLSHVCCGPCASWSVKALQDEGYDVTMLYSNSNIWPRQEHDKRLESARIVAAHYRAEIVEDDYDHDAWRAAVAGLEHELEGGARCARCFAFSLARAAARAEALGIPLVTTTLSISPHKNTEQLFAAGREAVAGRDVELLEKIFKKQGGYDKSLVISRELGLYRQTYCGCEFSLRESEERRKGSGEDA
jgi:epoxyqueuosine reductase